ncbi:hypothetical protein JCGZ_23261 [Jatropha curcas]|uniref:Uncharacterized protein n=1 Tax=Jatropha curcas TaxID=180498 RepID=A0A067JKT0_JATCU|nr:uncharacterized protein LOC110010896 [Jatropha curcas]KDP23428.1 hypothetical protein JCGZ_23261 [Jatropha curcas]
MIEENPDTCNRNSNSYLFSITISQPKIRIKIPKLLAKTMQKRSNGASNIDHVKEKKKKWGKFGSIFSSIFNTKKSPKVQRNDDDNISTDHQTGPSEAKILKRVDQYFAVLDDHDSSSSTSYSFNRLLQIEDEEEEKRSNKEKKGKSNKQPNKAEKHLKVSPSLSRLFRKSTSCNNFIKSKNHNISPTNVGKIAEAVVGGQASRVAFNRSTSDTMNLQQAPSRISTTHRKLKMAQSSSNQETSEREDRGGEQQELCKKRILMGEKCRPLSYSGTLQYDKDGTLLPDAIP